MIFYFSATGNSRWVAQQLAMLTGDKLFSITDILQTDRMPAVPADTEKVGVVYPTHGWYVPAPVLQFLSKLNISDSTYRYAVTTCGDDVGKGLSRLSLHFPLDAAWSVQMPNTYVPMFSLDDPVLARQKIAHARTQIALIAEAVNHKECLWNVCEGSWAWVKTYIVNPLFRHFYIGICAFHTDDSCISCGLCEQNCPVSAVHLLNGRPVWNHTCIHCMACLHGCPKGAIRYGKTTQAKGQYKLEDYL